MAVRRFMLSLLLLLTLAGTFPGAALALGVAGFDVSRGDTKNPDSAFHFDLKPGETTEERVILRSTTDTVQRLRIYSADGTPTPSGGIALKERQDERTGLSKWIEIDAEDLIELEPWETRTIWFKLTVPKSSDSNEDIAGIVVEQAKANKADTSKQFSINLLSRVAILISQRLPGPVNLKLDIINFGRANELWSQPVLFGLTLKNTGNVLVRPKGKVDIYNLFGGKSDSIKLRRLPTIFPGRTSEVQFQWEKAPPLGYFTANVSIEYDKGKAVTKRAHILILPWWLIFIVFPLWLIARQARQRRAAKQIDDKEKTTRQAQEAMDTLNRTVQSIEMPEPEPVNTPVATERSATPDAGAPTMTVTEEKPKRRGRPPKKKVEETTEVEAKPKRRDRPPKKKVDETAGATTTETKPKRRGRPPKKKVDETVAAIPETKPKRGRPPKKKVEETAGASEAKPKRRGRPPKKKAEETNED